MRYSFKSMINRAGNPKNSLGVGPPPHCLHILQEGISIVHTVCTPYHPALVFHHSTCHPSTERVVVISFTIDFGIRHPSLQDVREAVFVELQNNKIKRGESVVMPEYLGQLHLLAKEIVASGVMLTGVSTWKYSSLTTGRISHPTGCEIRERIF